ncbi:MAG: heme o synthase [bacterium]|nr:heme o synthase [bacterium]
MISSRGETLTVRGERGAAQRLADFIALTKPRLIPMVLVAAAAGFYLASSGKIAYATLLNSLIGIGLATGGTLALNQAAEQEVDALMRRTRTRPLPGGRLQRWDAIIFGTILTVGGIAYLYLAVNTLSGHLITLTGGLYLFLYTPLKRFTSLNSIVGAIPGAMPPVLGWAAAAGTLAIEPAILFAILFFWQIPHALAIAWLYRDEFARAGIRLLPVEEPDGKSTGRQVINHCVALLPVSLMPTLVGLAGPVYFFTALALGLAYLYFGVRLSMERNTAAARRLFYASLGYLPLVLLVMVLDQIKG